MKLLKVCMLAETFIENVGKLFGDATPTGSEFTQVGNKLRFAIAKAHGFHNVPGSAADKVGRESLETDGDINQRELQALQMMEDLLDRLNERPSLDLPLPEDLLQESEEVIAKIKSIQRDESARNEIKNLVFNCIQRRK